MHVKRAIIFICVLMGGGIAWLVAGGAKKSFPSKTEVVAGEDSAESDPVKERQDNQSQDSHEATENFRKSEPLGFPPKHGQISISKAKFDVDSFLKDFIFSAVSMDLTYQEAKNLLVSSGVTPIEEMQGNQDTGERIKLSFDEATSLGLSLFSITYQKGDPDAFDRLMYGRSPDPSLWNEEFQKMKMELEEKFSPYAISKKESELFVMWRFKDDKIVWIQGDHQGYGQKMILVGFEYEIH
jgi:hypothetical protein